jgi:hypothetical protein
MRSPLLAQRPCQSCTLRLSGPLGRACPPKPELPAGRQGPPGLPCARRRDPGVRTIHSGARLGLDLDASGVLLRLMTARGLEGGASPAGRAVKGTPDKPADRPGLMRGAGGFARFLDGVPFASLAAARAAHRLTGALCFGIEPTFLRFGSGGPPRRIREAASGRPPLWRAVRESPRQRGSGGNRDSSLLRPERTSIRNPCRKRASRCAHPGRGRRRAVRPQLTVGAAETGD